MYSKLWFIYLLHEAVLESLLCFYFFTMQLLVCLWYPVVVLYFSSFLSYLQLHIVFKKKKTISTLLTIYFYDHQHHQFFVECRKKNACFLNLVHHIGKLKLSANVEVDLCPNVSFATLWLFGTWKRYYNSLFLTS